MADIDSDLRHRPNREWVHRLAVAAGTHDLEPTLADRAQIALGHLAARGVVRAEEQDASGPSILIHPSIPFADRNLATLGSREDPPKARISTTVDASQKRG